MLGGILWFLWKMYLPNSFCFLLSDQIQLSTQSEPASTQKHRRPGRLIGHLQYVSIVHE